jgi:glycosyltransferase involved in cell wall biosynthesis
MSITEAMACGKVPLVTDWTFMNEAIKSYENGFLIPIANTCGDTTELYNGSPWGIPLGRIWGNVSINALAETMGACLTDQDLIKEMGKRGIEHVRRNYDWLDISGKLYREIMK